MSKIKKFTAAELRALREKTKMSQTAFWGKLGLSQSFGSWAEQGREMPRYIAKLVHLQYVLGVDVDTGEKREQD